MTQNSEVIVQSKLLDEYLSNKDNSSFDSATIQQYFNCTDNVDDSHNQMICNPTIHQTLTEQQISKCTNHYQNKSHQNVIDMLVDDNGSFVSYPTDDSDYGDDEDDDNVSHDTNTKFIDNVQRCCCKACIEYDIYKAAKSFKYDDEMTYDEFIELCSMLKYRRFNMNPETIRDFHRNDEGENVIAITDVFNQLAQAHGQYIDDKLNASQQDLSILNDENLALKHQIQDISKKIRVFMNYLIIFAMIIVFVVFLMGCFMVYQYRNVQAVGIRTDHRFNDIYDRLNVSMQLIKLQQLEQQYYIHSLKHGFEAMNSTFHEQIKTQQEIYDDLQTEISETNNNMTILRLIHENDYKPIEEVPVSNDLCLVVLVILLIIILIMIVRTSVGTKTVDEHQSNYMLHSVDVDHIENDDVLNQNDYSAPDVATNNNDEPLSPRILSEITDIVDNSFPIRDLNTNWQTFHVIQSQNSQNSENINNNELNNGDQYTSNNNNNNGGNKNNNNASGDKNGDNHGQNDNNDNSNNGGDHNNDNNHNGSSGNGGDDGDKNRKHNDKPSDTKKTQKSKKTKKKKQKTDTAPDMDNDDEICSATLSQSAPNPTTKKLNVNAAEYKPSSYSTPCNVKIKKNPYNIYVHSRAPPPDLFTIEESSDDGDIAPTLPMVHTTKHQEQIIDIISEQTLQRKMIPSTPKIKQIKNEKKCQISPKVHTPSTNKKKRKKSKKKKKQKQKNKITPKTNDNKPRYEPNGTLRGKGYIEITKEMVETIIPNAIKEGYLNLNHFIDRFTALNKGNTEFDTENGKIKILNCDFHDKDTNDILYCKCIKSTNRGYVWKIDNLMTAAQIMNEYGISADNLPKSPRNANKFTSRADHEKKIRESITNKETIYAMIEQTKWQNESDESVAVFGKEDGKRSMTLSVEKMEFIKQCKKYVNNNNNTNGDEVQLIPILIFEGTEYHIEYVWIVAIDNDKQNIGISFRYNEQNDIVKITAIHCDKNSLLEQHQLISPDITDEHKCNCLDNFESNITHLNVYGNPDKFYKDKYKKIKQFVKESVNTDPNHFNVESFRRKGREILSK